MTRLIARLILAMLILPVAGALFVFLFIVLMSAGRTPSLFRVLAFWAVIYLFVVVYWVLLWRSVVRWTRQRVVRTVLAMALALVFGTMFGAGLMEVGLGRDKELALFVGGGVVPMVWVLATVLIWRETPSERIERISLAGREAVCCPICG